MIVSESRTARFRPGRDESGSTVVETAVLIPVAMLIVMFVVQACIWAHAETLVENAVDQGEQVATTANSSLSAGVSAADHLLSETAGEMVVAPSTEVTRLPGDMVHFEITGNAESILPGFHFPVSAVQVGPVQEFRGSE